MDEPSTPQARQCPNCGQRLYFSGDGRSLYCERCNYQQAIEKPHLRPSELIRAQSFKAKLNREGHSPSTNVRERLRVGIAAAKAKDKDEARFYLQWVLQTQSSDSEQAQAWLWLSEVYDDPADKRECLEQVLALDPMNALARRGIAILDGRLNPSDIVDPNNLKPVVADEPQVARIEQFTCPRCSARMNYTPDGEALLCEYCHYRELLRDNQKKVPSEFGIGALEQDFISALATARGHLQPVSMRLLQCRSCAIEFVLAPETLSVTCPYCDSVYVAETAESQEIHPPQALIPFGLTTEDVTRRLRAWFKQQKIERPRLSPIVGIYLPMWTFDIRGELKWSGMVREYGNQWVPKSGLYYALFDDLIVPASRKLKPSQVQGLYDFDLDLLLAYDARYLADWPAERYQVALADASLEARRQVMTRLRRRPESIAGESVRSFRLGSTGLMIESFKLILLPVWLIHYSVEGRLYELIINGQNGAIYGEKPGGTVRKFVDWLKGS